MTGIKQFLDVAIEKYINFGSLAMYHLQQKGLLRAVEALGHDESNIKYHLPAQRACMNQ